MTAQELPPENSAAGPAEAPRSGAIWPRALLVVLWAAAANWWSERNLGVGLDNPIALLGLAGPVAVGSYILDWLVEAKEKEEVRQRWFARLRGWLGRPWTKFLVIALYVLGGLGALTCGSLVVTGAHKTTVRDLAGREIASIESSGEAGRALIATNPLGRDLKIEVAGFIPQTLTFYPLFGQTIDPAQSLQPVPTLLFRPTIDALDSLGVGGVIRVFKVEGNTCTLIGTGNAAKTRRSVMIGTEIPITDSSVEKWSIELAARGVTGQPSAQALEAWRQPELIATREPVAPGARIYVVVSTHAGKPKADALAIVGHDALQDIAMHAASAAIACPNPD